MIDLNNTKCEATKENLEKLKQFVSNIETYIDSSLKFDSYLYVKDNFLNWGHKVCLCQSFWNDFKDIHLIDGEFQYVDAKHNNNFKEYDFEADFEGEILKTFTNCNNEKEIFIGYYVDNGAIVSSSWDNKGYCFTSTQYNIKPIKKEWYENHDNFPCLVYGEFTKIQGWEDEEDETIFDFCIIDSPENIFDMFISEGLSFRPATKEEVLKLVIDENKYSNIHNIMGS